MSAVFAPCLLMTAAWAIQGAIQWAVSPDEPDHPLSRFVSLCGSLGDWLGF